MDARIAFILVLLLVPLAAADHVFSHRVYVIGRVIDREGLPVSGLSVNATFEGLRGGRCFESKPETTSPTGDYEICRHSHEIPVSTNVTVRVAGAERIGAVDPDLRHASANLQLDGPTPARDIQGERTFSRSLLVTGRAFEILRAPFEEEGVSVTARPIGENVTVELRDGPDVLANATTRPDEHGLYRVELPVEAIPPGATVSVRSGPDGTQEVVPELFRRADVNVVRDRTLLAGQPLGAPGSETPLGAWLAILAFTLVAVAQRARRSGRAR